MSSKKAKCNEQEQRIQQLEQEVEDLKRELENQDRVIKFDEQQIEKYFDKITNKLDVSTDRLCEEVNLVVKSMKEPKTDEIANFLKLIIAGLSAIVSISIIIYIYNAWKLYWNNGCSGWYWLFVHISYCIAFCLLACEIFKEKDRSYIVSLFSAVVALAALFVTLYK